MLVNLSYLSTTPYSVQVNVLHLVAGVILPPQILVFPLRYCLLKEQDVYVRSDDGHVLSVQRTTQVYADDKMVLGLEVFNNKGQCGVCHTLEVAGSDGQIGSNLDELKPKLEQVIFTVTNGIGVMPAFDTTLTIEEIEAVAYYVFINTNN